MLEAVIGDIENDTIGFPRSQACPSSNTLYIQCSGLGRSCHKDTGCLRGVVALSEDATIAKDLQRSALVVMQEALAFLGWCFPTHQRGAHPKRLEGLSQMLSMS